MGDQDLHSDARAGDDRATHRVEKKQRHQQPGNLAAEEAEERRRRPPVDTGSPPPEDAAGRVSEDPLTDTRDRHTSHKAGSRSIAQKESQSRYPDRSMPASRKVAGAFGREPKG